MIIVMHRCLIFFTWTSITFVGSAAFPDEPSLFDDPSSLPDDWLLSDLSSLPEPDLSGSEPMSSIFSSSDDSGLNLDTTLFADDNVTGELPSLSGLDQLPSNDYGTLFDEASPGDISLNWEADCGDQPQTVGKRRAKRGASCKNPPVTGTEQKPDGTGPPPPSPGNGPSFFPGYREYVMDDKTNVLRIPGFSPRYFGENDVCLIYTEGYLPYGVCGTELFKSTENFWGIDTFTITKAVLGK